MEIALDPRIPTYAGGLGILAGDTLRSAADAGLAMVAVTLAHRRGYFRQRLDAHGVQTAEPVTWQPEMYCQPVPVHVTVPIENRRVVVRAWTYDVPGQGGGVIPVYLLDTSDEANDPWDRSLTDVLYGGDSRYRLAQEVVLGMGGVALLDALGYHQIATFHMNEGHSALLALALLQRERPFVARVTERDMDAVRQHCVFTTHTPVPAGHDQFPKALVRQVLGSDAVAVLESTRCCMDHTLNMTYLALRCSHYINGVAMQHGEVSRGLFPNYTVRAITNGVHAVGWTSPFMAGVFDRHLPEWRRDNNYLRYAIGIPVPEIAEAHRRAKRRLIDAVRADTGLLLDETALTMGFARRATGFKRADLVFRNVERLRWMSQHVGPVQFVFAGKAHPQDESGKALIRRVFDAAACLKGVVPVAYLEEYDVAKARLLTSGVDLWLNTPQRPLEASGTSGMKAALNGVPSLSVLDGWWLEGHVEGVTGWSIGPSTDASPDAGAEAAALYEKLEAAILPLYYGRPAAFGAIRRSTIALNGSFFNTQRMLAQYVAHAYERIGTAEPCLPPPDRAASDRQAAAGGARP